MGVILGVVHWGWWVGVVVAVFFSVGVLINISQIFITKVVYIYQNIICLVEIFINDFLVIEVDPSLISFLDFFSYLVIITL